MTDRDQNPYETLGLEFGASPREVKSAYRALAALYHPDRVSALSESVREAASKKMVRLNAAWDAIERGWTPAFAAEQEPSSQHSPTGDSQQTKCAELSPLRSGEVMVLDDRNLPISIGIRFGFSDDGGVIVFVPFDVFDRAAYARDAKGPVRDVVFMRARDNLPGKPPNGHLIRVLDAKRRFVGFGQPRGRLPEGETLIEVPPRVYELAAYAEGLLGPMPDIVFTAR